MSIRVYRRTLKSGKESKVWQYSFTIRGAQRVQESAHTEDEQTANLIAAKHFQKVFDELHLGKKPERTWPEAVIKWARIAKDKKSFNTDQYRLSVLDPHFRDKTLTELTRDYIDEVIDELADDREWSNGSINRYLAVIRTILKKACDEWEWIDKVPKLPKRTEAAKRVRWINEGEARRLIEEVPTHTKFIVVFDLATGLRKSNLLGLKWKQIDLERRCAWVYGDEAKGKKDIAIPLNDDAMAVLLALRGQHSEYVFTYKGNPIRSPDRISWIKWCARAGITKFRFHDLRHTWASWFVQRGGNLNDLMELGGWSSYEMVLKYAHLSAARLHSSAKITVTNLLGRDTSVTLNELEALPSHQEMAEGVDFKDGAPGET